MVSHFLEKGHTPDHIQWSILQVMDKDKRGGSMTEKLLRAEARTIEKCKIA